VKSGGDGTTNLHMQLINSGTVRIDRGVLALGCGYVQPEGSSGTVSGNVTGDVSNPGQFNLNPSLAPPVLTNYTQTITSTLAVQIGGLIPGTQYGQLIVTGSVNLAGSLQVQLINGFMPQLGDHFIIIDNRGTAPINGTFTGLPEGATFNVSGYQFKISYVGGS